MLARGVCCDEHPDDCCVIVFVPGVIWLMSADRGGGPNGLHANVDVEAWRAGGSVGAGPGSLQRRRQQSGGCGGGGGRAGGGVAEAAAAEAAAAAELLNELERHGGESPTL